ncbi:hypothetical protein F5Y03DRAFT_151334 [Xylaria venustula]|nr:hypothetical protein F5Y03DRAFT_151334 [Xylaria venustula]
MPMAASALTRTLLCCVSEIAWSSSAMHKSSTAMSSAVLAAASIRRSRSPPCSGRCCYACIQNKNTSTPLYKAFILSFCFFVNT